jgi:hypothetical protein
MADPLALKRLDVMLRLSSETGQPLRPLSWWGAVLDALEHHVVTVLLTPRQDGKSTFLLALAVATLLTVRDSYIVFVAPSIDQAEAIIRRKLRRPLARLLHQLQLPKAVKVSGSVVECGLTGSTLEIVAATEFTSPGRSVNLLLVDEGKGIPDPVFEAVAPSVIGAAGQIVVASTAGRPSGWLYELVQHPGEGVWVHRESENTNPYASKAVLGALERMFSWLNPSARERELHSEFAADGDRFLPAELIQAGIDDGLAEVAYSEAEAFGFYDLSRRRHLTSRVVLLREAARRPEVRDHLVVASIRTWDPTRSPTGEVDFASVRADLQGLPERFPRLRRVFVDEGAEAGSLLPFARAHPWLSTRIEGFQMGVGANMQLWGALAARLHAQTLSLPRHERLLAELRSLKQESLAFGSKWRVTDASRRYHRDVSVSLAGAVLAAELMPAHSGPMLWGGPVGPDPRDVGAIQIEEDERDEERRLTSAAHVREQVRRHGVFWPGQG